MLARLTRSAPLLTQQLLEAGAQCANCQNAHLNSSSSSSSFNSAGDQSGFLTYITVSDMQATVQVQQPERWDPIMDTPVMHLEHWRKSHEWFALSREHAQLAADDVAVEATFRKYCNGKDLEAADGTYALKTHIPSSRCLSSCKAKRCCIIITIKDVLMWDPASDYCGLVTGASKLSVHGFFIGSLSTCLLDCLIECSVDCLTFQAGNASAPPYAMIIMCCSAITIGCSADDSNLPSWARGDRKRDCFSDEHYFGTLLAAHGRDQETDCEGEITHVDWSRSEPMSGHPYAYKVEDITSDLHAPAPLFLCPLSCLIVRSCFNFVLRLDCCSRHVYQLWFSTCPPGRTIMNTHRQLGLNSGDTV